MASATNGRSSTSPANLSRTAGRRKIEAAGPKVSAQRRRQFLARVQEMAADLKTRP